MRTLTVYVVRHADDAPMDVFPTMKAANAFLRELADDNGGHPLCPEWRAESRTFEDNSTGVATMMSWLLGQCADELVSGMQAHRELEHARDWLSSMISAGSIHLAHDDDWPRLTCFVSGGSAAPSTDLEIGTPEVLPPKPAEVH